MTAAKAVPTLGVSASAGDPRLDLERLIASRLLLQANSGGGKSRALRYLLEGTHGRVQQIILDPEGEFASLRERFDYVLAGRDGDVPAHPKTAAMLARRLMELGVSAVVDLYDLSTHDRREFVKRFLDELMRLPRALWRPLLVVIDEAHIFAPERGAGESQALESVITLCTQGRKRGYAACLATQRISKLHKDAAAELLNKFIGRTGLDVDVKRAADELGLDKEARQALRTLSPGQFFVYGPAIANAVTLVRTGDVRTSHPQVGQAAAPPPPAPAKLRAVLEQLGSIPREAEEEAKTVADLTKVNAELRAQVRKLERGVQERVVEKPVADQAAIDAAVQRARRDQAHAVLEAVGPLRREMETAAHRLIEALQGAFANAHGIPATMQEPSLRVAAATRALVRRPATDPAATSVLPVGERTVLTAVASYPEGVDRDQLSVLTGYKRSSRNTYLSRLLGRSYVIIAGETIHATPDGIAALGRDFEPLPSGEALQAYWLERLPEGERRIFEAVLGAYPGAVERDDLDAVTGYKRSSRNTYISRLLARRVVTTSSSMVRASDTLFGGGRGHA